MRKNPHVRIRGGLGSVTALVYPTPERDRYDPRAYSLHHHRRRSVLVSHVDRYPGFVSLVDIATESVRRGDSPCHNDSKIRPEERQVPRTVQHHCARGNIGVVSMNVLQALGEENRLGTVLCQSETTVRSNSPQS